MQGKDLFSRQDWTPHALRATPLRGKPYKSGFPCSHLFKPFIGKANEHGAFSMTTTPFVGNDGKPIDFRPSASLEMDMSHFSKGDVMSKTTNEKQTIGIRVSKEEKECFEGLAKAHGCTVTDILRLAVKEKFGEIRNLIPASAVSQNDDSVKTILEEILAVVKGKHQAAQEQPKAPVHVDEPLSVEAVEVAFADAKPNNPTGYGDPVQGIGRHEKDGLFIAEIPFTITQDPRAKDAVFAIRNRIGDSKVFNDVNSKGGKSWFIKCEKSDDREKMLKEFFANAGFFAPKANA